MGEVEGKGKGKGGGVTSLFCTSDLTAATNYVPESCMYFFVLFTYLFIYLLLLLLLLFRASLHSQISAAGRYINSCIHNDSNERMRR